ncbi:type II toxin-antitoxin system toxin ribonuclease C26 [soil metagenome]
MRYILDSGFLYARLNEQDVNHQNVSSVSLPANELIYLPVPAITEVTYLLGRDIGTQAVAEFVDALSRSNFILEAPAAEDFTRSAEILRQYGDNNIDFVDACSVAMAERLEITKILTVDRRHFSAFRPRHCDAFELLP